MIPVGDKEPPPRAYCTFTLDNLRKRGILVGGLDITTNTPCNDVWEVSLSRRDNAAAEDAVATVCNHCKQPGNNASQVEYSVCVRLYMKHIMGT